MSRVLEYSSLVLNKYITNRLDRLYVLTFLVGVRRAWDLKILETSRNARRTYYQSECFLENTNYSQVNWIGNTKNIFNIHDEASTVSFQKGLEGWLSFKINVVVYTVNLFFQSLVGLWLLFLLWASQYKTDMNLMEWIEQRVTEMIKGLGCVMQEAERWLAWRREGRVLSMFINSWWEGVKKMEPDC